MSLTLNMIGGGGGGLSDTDAVLTVSVPTGSTVTAVKGGITLTPTIWVQDADNTLDYAIFSISPSMFDAVNPWTVTGTRGTDSDSQTVTISTNKQYEVSLSYILVLFEFDPNDYDAQKENWAIMDDSSRSVISNGTDHMVFTASGSAQRGWTWKTGFDLSDYNILYFDGYVSTTGTTHHEVCIRNNYGTSNWKTDSLLTASITNTARSTTNVDISSINVSTPVYPMITISPSAAFHVWSIKVKR